MKSPSKAFYIPPLGAADRDALYPAGGALRIAFPNRAISIQASCGEDIPSFKLKHGRCSPSQKSS